GHVDPGRDELVAVRRVVPQEGALHEPDGHAVDEDHEVLSRLLAPHGRPEVALERVRRRLVVPPARDVRLGEPRAERRQVLAREAPERDLGVAWRAHVAARRFFSASTSKSAGGQPWSSPRSASSRSSLTARRANHLRSAGIAYHGAVSVLVRSRTAW